MSSIVTKCYKNILQYQKQSFHWIGSKGIEQRGLFLSGNCCRLFLLLHLTLKTVKAEGAKVKIEMMDNNSDAVKIKVQLAPFCPLWANGCPLLSSTNRLKSVVPNWETGGEGAQVCVCVCLCVFSNLSINLTARQQYPCGQCGHSSSSLTTASSQWEALLRLLTSATQRHTNTSISACQWHKP